MARRILADLIAHQGKPLPTRYPLKHSGAMWAEMGFARRAVLLSQTFLSCPVCFRGMTPDRATEVAQPHLYHTQSIYGWFSPLALVLYALFFIFLCCVSLACASQSWWLAAPLDGGAGAGVVLARAEVLLLYVMVSFSSWVLSASCWATAGAYSEHRYGAAVLVGHRCRQQNSENVFCGKWEDTKTSCSVF